MSFSDSVWISMPDDLARQQLRAAAALQLQRLKTAARFAEDPWAFHIESGELPDQLALEGPG